MHLGDEFKIKWGLQQFTVVGPNLCFSTRRDQYTVCIYNYVMGVKYFKTIKTVYIPFYEDKYKVILQKL